MARGTRTVYPGKQNKGLSSTFQPPEESQSVQQPKRWDKHGDKDEDNSPKNVNDVPNTSFEKYRQLFVNLYRIQCCLLINSVTTCLEQE